MTSKIVTMICRTQAHTYIVRGRRTKLISKRKKTDRDDDRHDDHADAGDGGNDSLNRASDG